MGFSFFLLLFILFTAMTRASKGISQYVPSCISIEMTSNCFQFLLDDKKWRIFRSERFDSIVISLIILFVRHDDEIVFIQKDRTKEMKKQYYLRLLILNAKCTHTHTNPKDEIIETSKKQPRKLNLPSQNGSTNSC